MFGILGFYAYEQNEYTFRGNNTLMTFYDEINVYQHLHQLIHYVNIKGILHSFTAI